nr:SDR family oxidoreductase [Candidatus Sigynarchaeota archaeon]
MLDKNLLMGKRAVITGASRGIGKALSLGFANLGAAVGLISRSESDISKNAATINDRGGKAAYAVADMTKSAQVQDAMEKIAGELGGIDILVNNAGVTSYSNLPENFEEIDKIIDTNLKGVMYGTLAALPFLAKQGGAIVSTSSGTAQEAVAAGAPFNGAYTASKAGVNLFTISSAAALTPKKITINALMCPFVATDMIKDIPKTIIDMFGGAMQPEELVPFYAFFASKEAKRVTGTLVNVKLLYDASKFAEGLPKEKRKSWPDLEPGLQDFYKAEPKYFTHVKKNVKLFMFLVG